MHFFLAEITEGEKRDRRKLACYGWGMGMKGFNIDSGTLFASMFWGAVASGYLIYGWKQKRAPALWGGIAMMALTYFIASALWMSLASIGLIVGVYYWSKMSD